MNTATTDRRKAEQLITDYLAVKDKGTRFSGETAYDAAIANLSLDIEEEDILHEALTDKIYAALPGTVKRLLSKMDLSKFVRALNTGFTLYSAAATAGIPLDVATEILKYAQGIGLL